MLKTLLPVFFIFISTPLFSWSVSKLSQEISSNKKREYTISVISKEDTAVPLEVCLGKRSITEDGNDSYDKIDEHDFFIYPSVFVLQPGLTQKIRVRWLGDVNTIENEQAYRICVKEMPTKPKLSNAGVENVNFGLKFLKTFVGSIFIVPKKAESHIEIVSSNITHTKDGDLLHLTLENLGKKHKLYQKPFCELSNKKNRFSFTPQIQGNSTINIFPGNKRLITIELPPEWKEKIDNEKDLHISFTDQAKS